MYIDVVIIISVIQSKLGGKMDSRNKMYKIISKLGTSGKARSEVICTTAIDFESYYPT